MAFHICQVNFDWFQMLDSPQDLEGKVHLRKEGGPRDDSGMEREGPLNPVDEALAVSISQDRFRDTGDGVEHTKVVEQAQYDQGRLGFRAEAPGIQSVDTATATSQDVGVRGHHHAKGTTAWYRTAVRSKE